MLKQETIDFLKNVSPFDLFKSEDLESIVEDIALEYYPKGVTILSQGGAPSEYLRIIKRGGVKVFVTSDQGEEIIIDYRSEGEQFGFISVVSGDRSRANIVAVEDTICYLIPKDKILAILQKSQEASEYYLKSFFINFIDKTRNETRKRFSSFGDGDRLLFTVPVGNIVRKEPVTADKETKIQLAAQMMAKERISSLVITNGTSVPIGIVTDRDLREKVVAKGRSLDEPVRHIMSTPLIKVDSEEFCFEALLKMMRHKIHHILVVESGSFKGIVTNHDFMLLQGASPTVIVKEIESIQGIENLERTIPKLHKTVATLLREGARANNITGLITELSEKLINRVVDIIEKKLGGSPLDYSMFFIGDGARRELSLTLDFTLGIVYEDTNNLTIIRNTENYFKEFLSQLNKSLVSCCITSNKEALVMDNIRSFADWKVLFKKAADEPFITNPRFDIYDMRAIRGEENPVSALREYVLELSRTNEEVMDFIATMTVDNRPPLGFFKKFVVEKSGEHRNELNLYLKGVRPLVDSTRIFCMEKGLLELSTARRLHTLRSKYKFEEAENIEHALDYLLTLLIHNQLVQIEMGYQPDTFVNPESLSGLEKKTLKESFQLTANLYDILEKSYRTERS